MKSDNFSILDSDHPLQPGWQDKLTATIGNYAKVTFRITNYVDAYSQFIIATITPLPDALIQFELFEGVNPLAEASNGILNYPKALIHLLKETRNTLIERGYMPSPAINVSYKD